jgi:CRISPR-associated protein Cas1
MSTLYVTEPGARVEKEYRHLLVTVDDETLLRAPLADVGHVVLVGQGVGVTTPALHALLAAGVTLSLVKRSGELLGRLVPPSGKNLELRRRQYARAADPTFCLAFARQVVLGKLQNYRALALRWSRGDASRQLAPQLARLAEALAQAEHAADLATLRGLEGAGSKAYFAVFRACLRPDFTFEKRTRRPPRDPTNALLSLGYTLLGEAIATALEVVGLDPYEGLYHADKYGRPALALDLLEEFRGPIVDSVALTLINKRMLTPDDFDGPTTEDERPAAEDGGPATKSDGCYLNKQGLRVYLREFSERLQATFTHPLAGRPLTYQKCLEVQARQVAKLVMGEAAVYRPLRVR